MTLSGTVVNGVIVLNGGVQLPEGTHVRIELEDDRAKELAILRESLEDVKAGRSIPARQALADLARKYGLPLEPGE